MFEDEVQNPVKTTGIDADTFQKMYAEARAREIQQEEQRRNEERLKQEEEKRRQEELQREEEKKKLANKSQEYTKKYQEQPRDIRDNLMEYSDVVGVDRANVMEFAENLAKKTGKDIKDVSKFLVENKRNSDLDVKINTSYEDLIDRFAKYMDTNTNTNASNPMQQQAQQNAFSYDNSSAPRYQYTPPPTSLPEEIENKIASINEEFQNKMEMGEFNPNDVVLLNSKRVKELESLSHTVRKKLEHEANLIQFERQKREMEARSRRLGYK